VSNDGDRASVRLAELVAALSLGVDLGFGQPMEHVLRQCLIALRLAERLGLDDERRADVYYTALLVNVGCHADAHEQAKWFGDDIALKSTKYDHEVGSVRGAAAAFRLIGAGNPPLHRFRVALEFMLAGHRDVDGMVREHARVARLLGEQLNMSAGVLASLASAYEMWNGKGWPGELRGEEVPLAARLAQLAEYAEVAHRVGGVEAAKELARGRAGKQFDPSLAELICSDADPIFAGLDGIGTWEAVIDAEPGLALVLSGEQFDAALLAIANFVDLKSPYTLGHAGAVAELVAEAGRQLGLPEPEIRTLRRAGLVHDLGRLGVSNAIWDKPGPLGAGEWERVRLHPYLTERMLYQAAALAPLAAIAVAHRERLDGSGYPRRLAGSAIPRLARILGAADAYQAMREPRPYRPPHSLDQAANELRADVKSGRLDAEAVEAVLGAAGHKVSRRRGGPAGLTPREIEVLRLLARGLSNKEIASRLVISPKTVANHVEHIYAKIDASTRATASLFAMQHGLLPEDAVEVAA
jgi:HD-GYP domain-containing protein (c-di-GMP phosphodiesterase class II)